jgi:transcription elongation factor Elf1
MSNIVASASLELIQVLRCQDCNCEWTVADSPLTDKAFCPGCGVEIAISATLLEQRRLYHLRCGVADCQQWWSKAVRMRLDRPVFCTRCGTEQSIGSIANE